ncbi:MAG: SUMF1/EgtB/PvdO family nonheme iron enzyme [Candidatus Cloacimonadota bacterium]|nr:SUMF1/EgtB/PvdO family nonheme iron enzyme [Candidatus Cloacimonadota bacterium]
MRKKKLVTSLVLIITVLFIITSCSDDSTGPNDTTAPEVMITYPVDNAEITAGIEVTIRAEATDNETVSSVIFYINGEQQYEDTSSPYSFDWDTTSLNGAFNLYAKAIDGNDNQTSSDIVTVTIIPTQLYNPTPEDNATDVSLTPTLSWECSDPDGDDLTYDVYWGTSSNPQLMSEDQTELSFNPDNLDYETTYYWKVVADDGEYQVESDLWSFTTEELEPGTMIFVEGGTFQMGDRFNEGSSSELPLHNVTLNSFYMAETEVTQGEYEALIGNNPSQTSYGIGENHPVSNLSWYDMIAYCNAKSTAEGLTPVYSGSGTGTICDWNANGYRLPTEAEWEYAARGGINEADNYRYSGCHNEADLPDYAWYSSNGGSYCKEVGTKQPNQLGLYDMSGNVYEWCWDCYDSSYYSSSPSSNPHGANSGSYRVFRGGYWYYSADYCRVAYRDGYYPSYSFLSLGFRICRNNPE